MAETLPLEQIEKNASTIYEAIVMVARRARQINELQKRILDDEAEAISQTEEFDDEGINADIVERQFLKLPKPTTIALQEMIEGKLERVENQVEE
ncbi:MAG TPA: DNA-directed RNA polymerase subunit omega [bacterium]|nr:DNA-directed RNA polymerase subunit omega [bacterium]HPN43106.1 DNA-directed RNA polymerase subunit omega [bacterium]